MKRVGLYAGTFDPLTNGHLWIIREAAELFDEVVVAVANNPDKRGKTMFGIEDRMGMIREAVQGVNGVTVTSYAEDFAPPFTVRYALSVGATHLVRGIRNEEDFGKEQAIRHINQDICPSVKTLFLVPPRNLSEVSSSMVKGLVGFQDWREIVGRYVPSCVVKRFQAARLGSAEVMMRLGADRETALAAAACLQSAYTQSVRRYHNITHIEECLQMLRLLVSDQMVTPCLFDYMAAAIWFHDCVYDPKADDNEERSAEMYNRFGNLQPVRDMILATKTHNEDTEYSIMLVNDIDLSILGASFFRFLQYENTIRTEYQHAPNVVFYPARKKFILNLLHSGIYKTQMFKTMLTANAEDNIKWLLESEKYREV